MDLSDQLFICHIGSHPCTYLCCKPPNLIILYVLFYLRYVSLKACISRLPENAEAPTPVQWPARLMEPPKRLQGVEMDAYSSKNELFKAETKFWEDIIDGYIRVFKWRKFKLRNVMDMRAGFGGYFSQISSFHLLPWMSDHKYKFIRTSTWSPT